MFNPHTSKWKPAPLVNLLAAGSVALAWNACPALAEEPEADAQKSSGFLVWSPCEPTNFYEDFANIAEAFDPGDELRGRKAIAASEAAGFASVQLPQAGKVPALQHPTNPFAPAPSLFPEGILGQVNRAFTQSLIEEQAEEGALSTAKTSAPAAKDEAGLVLN